MKARLFGKKGLNLNVCVLRPETSKSMLHPRTRQIVDTLALKYLSRDYFKAKVYTIWVHGPLGILYSRNPADEVSRTSEVAATQQKPME